MTPAAFRRIALALEGAEERAHHGHPDFRVQGRVFGSLGYPDRQWGMVVLTPDQQRRFVREHKAFVPVKGAWGEQGCTSVRLDAVEEETLGEAITIAWQHAAAKGPARARRTSPASARTPRGAAASRARR